MKIGQLNLAGSSNATRSSTRCAANQTWTSCFSRSCIRRPTSSRKPGTVKAGLYIHRSRSRAVLQLLTTYLVAHLVECDLHVVSAYFQYGEAIEYHLHHLEGAMKVLHGKSVLLCAEANGHSPMVHSETRHFIGSGHNSEYRRIALKGFIAAHRLI